MLTARPQADEKSQETQSLVVGMAFLCRISFYPGICQSLIPFILIQYMANNHAESFTQVALKATLPIAGDLEDQKLITSCINTASGIALIFFGRTKASKIFNKLFYRNIITIKVPLDNGETWYYKVNDLIDGELIRKTIDSELESMDTKTKEQHIERYLTRLFDQTNPIISELGKLKKLDKTNLEREFNQIKYPFNDIVLDDLRDEISFINRKKIDQNTSVIYTVYIGIPSEVCEHIFHIEQFFSPRTQSIRHRIYQSWIGKTTLAQDLTRKGYGCNGEHSMDLSEIDSFLSDLWNLCCNFSIQDRKAASTKCFGFGNNQGSSMHFFSSKTDSFEGLTVRYYSQEINPSDCIHHVCEAIQAQVESKPFIQI